MILSCNIPITKYVTYQPCTYLTYLHGVLSWTNQPPQPLFFPQGRETLKLKLEWVSSNLFHSHLQFSLFELDKVLPTNKIVYFSAHPLSFPPEKKLSWKSVSSFVMTYIPIISSSSSSFSSTQPHLFLTFPFIPSWE